MDLTIYSNISNIFLNEAIHMEILKIYTTLTKNKVLLLFEEIMLEQY